MLEHGTDEAKAAANVLRRKLRLLDSTPARDRVIKHDEIIEQYQALRFRLDDAKEKAQGSEHPVFLNNPGTWDSQLREEVFGVLQTAWAATRFHHTQTAKLLDEDSKLVRQWLESESFSTWCRDRGPRTLKVAAVADLALARMVEILLIESLDPQILRIQATLAAQVFGGGGIAPNTAAPNSMPTARDMTAPGMVLLGGHATVPRVPRERVVEPVKK